MQGMAAQYTVPSCPCLPHSGAVDDHMDCRGVSSRDLRHIRNAKNYGVKFRFLQQLVVDGQVELVYCPTNYQLADAFTKPLDEARFLYFRNQLLSER